MRCLVGLVCVLALGFMPVMGCTDDSGDGGMGGDGGTGGMPECESAEDCDDRYECTTDTCVGGMCEHMAVDDGTACAENNECAVGQCASGACELTPVQDGTMCSDDKGTCQQGSCRMACTEQGIRDAIASGGGPYTFECGDGMTVVIVEPIVIDNDVKLDGAGRLTVEYRGHDGAFKVKPPEGETATVGLSGFVVTTEGFDVTTCDWGINNSGTLQLNDVTVTEYCLGVFNDATLSMSGTTVSNPGAGIQNEGTLTVVNSTVSANSPGIHNRGIATLTHTTVSVASIEVGVRNEGTLTVASSLFDGKCEGDITSDGYNIESPGNTCGFNQTGDQPGVTEAQLNLGPLTDNGGPTLTHKPGDGGFGDDSFAIDAIPLFELDCRPVDQRGEPRPETGGTMCDVGAVEVQP